MAQVCPPFTQTLQNGTWWVGSLEELGANVVPAPSGNTFFPLLANTFSAPSKTAAMNSAGKCLLAGPFATQAAAQQWANQFNTNPNTVQAGSGLSPTTGTTTAGTGTPPGATGLGNALNNIDDFFAKLKDGNLWLRTAEVILGTLLIVASVGKLTGANNVITSAVKKVPILLCQHHMKTLHLCECMS